MRPVGESCVIRHDPKIKGGCRLHSIAGRDDSRAVKDLARQIQHLRQKVMNIARFIPHRDTVAFNKGVLLLRVIAFLENCRSD
jgi:hypothetical protein